MKPERRHGPTSLATLLTSIGSVLLVGFGVTAQTVTYEGRTILDGVYTASQAVEGADKYEGNCVHCHEGIDPDGPVLRGRSFIDRWRESNLDALYNHIRTRMPADGAGQLSDESYIQILAYMLGASDYPTGREELHPEALSSIRIVGMDGPQPLPRNTLVKVVGCLTPGENDSWVLAAATEPARIWEGRGTSPEEIADSLRTSPGTRTFPLGNFTNIRYDFEPRVYAGHRVQAKGVLIRRSSGERISLTALDSVAPNCE